MKEQRSDSELQQTQINQSTKKTNQTSVQERSSKAKADHKTREATALDNPELAVEGQVVSWLIRKENGAVEMGDLYPPGNYTLIPCPKEREPRKLQGEKITGDQAGWFRAPGDMSLSYSVPTTAGKYLLVTQVQD